MTRSHPRYAPEFRAEAIRLVREVGRSPKQPSADLGCSEASISGWLKQAEVDAGQRHDGLTTPEREELRQFRAKNRVLRMERDLLKKRWPSSPRRATRSGVALELHCGGE